MTTTRIQMPLPFDYLLWRSRDDSLLGSGRSLDNVFWWSLAIFLVRAEGLERSGFEDLAALNHVDAEVLLRLGLGRRRRNGAGD